MFRRKSFTLIEVLVSSIIILVGTAFLLAGVLSSKFFLKRAENKEKALRIADTVMQRFLTYSYEELDCNSLSCQGNETLGNLTIDWQANIIKNLTRGKRSKNNVPYKEITVTANYQEELGSNPHTRAVTLKNIVPYPYVHVNSEEIAGNPTASVPYGKRSNPNKNYQNIPRASITVSYERPKDILLFYNITLNIENYTGIEDGDTVYTRVVMSRGSHKVYSLNSRTPIKTQPLISNAVSFQNIKKDKSYTFTIQWYKDTSAGTITLRNANIIVVAIER